MNTAKINACLFLTLLTVGVLTPAQALDTDKYQPMKVSSNSATYDRDNHTITYEGNVQAEQGSSHLDGDKLIVYQTEENRVKEAVTFGKPAHYDTLPSPDKKRLYVEALKITYNPNDKTVLLEGNGKVTQDGNVFTGSHIWYDMVNGIVRSQPTKTNERTVVIIQPQTVNSDSRPK